MWPMILPDAMQSKKKKRRKTSLGKSARTSSVPSLDCGDDDGLKDLKDARVDKTEARKSAEKKDDKKDDKKEDRKEDRKEEGKLKKKERSSKKLKSEKSVRPHSSKMRGSTVMKKGESAGKVKLRKRHMLNATRCLCIVSRYPCFAAYRKVHSR